jgi:uncharacterized protein YdeI (YjbR/CyaY-like superfamily)
MKPKFFETPAAWRGWLEKYHGQRQELLVGFYKKGSGKPSITWPESVDGALCFGWIDGIRRNIDDVSYSIRFTPRKPRSNWSAINIKRVAELTGQGLMRPAGVKAFAARTEERSGIYLYERRSMSIEFDAARELRFRTNATAWKFFQSQPHGYRRMFTGWVMSAKREETREKRLAILIEESEQGRRVDPLAPRRGRGGKP